MISTDFKALSLAALQMCPCGYFYRHMDLLGLKEASEGWNLRKPVDNYPPDVRHILNPLC